MSKDAERNVIAHRLGIARKALKEIADHKIDLWDDCSDGYSDIQLTALLALQEMQKVKTKKKKQKKQERKRGWISSKSHFDNDKPSFAINQYLDSGVTYNFDVDERFPYIQKALGIIIHANGLGCFDTFVYNCSFTNNELFYINSMLSELDDEDMLSMCDEETDERARIVSEHDWGKLADEFLNDFFNGV